jgi:ribA/ribD-fused uncharacterized protein
MIKSFGGPYRFLSNFWPSPVVFEGHSYRTVEHAYQAAKTLDEDIRERIRRAPSPAEARRLGKAIHIRDGWDGMRIDVMRGLLQQKFGTNPLREMLKRTGKQRLVEGNWWGDRFWGVCNNAGENNLGKLLMEIRDGIVHG